MAIQNRMNKVVRVSTALILCVSCSWKINSENKKIDFSGTWVLRDYIKTLAIEKSPYQAYRTLTGLSCLFVPREVSDTTHVGYFYKNNQAGDMSIARLNDHSFIFVDEGSATKGSLKLSTSKGDTLLLVHEDDSVPIKELVFKKVSTGIIHNPLDFFSNRLFIGRYDVYDPKKSKILFHNVEMDNSLSIKRFQDFSHFHVVTDYAVQPGDFDMIVFSTGDDKSAGFSFKFDGGNFSLFSIISHGDFRQGQEPTIGSMQYFFRKLDDRTR
jgi:hypothetical protein